MSGRLAVAFAIGTVAGAVAHKRYVGPLFAWDAVRQIVMVRHEAIAATTAQRQERYRIMSTTEDYPVTISQPPAIIANHRVLAWAELRRTSGNYPGGIVLAVSNPEYERHEFVTWMAYTEDGGETWSATTGHYLTDHGAAWRDFLERCYALATEY